MAVSLQLPVRAAQQHPAKMPTERSPLYPSAGGTRAHTWRRSWAICSELDWRGLDAPALRSRDARIRVCCGTGGRFGSSRRPPCSYCCADRSPTRDRPDLLLRSPLHRVRSFTSPPRRSCKPR
jgi:hypothetical protein